MLLREKSGRDERDTVALFNHRRWLGVLGRVRLWLVALVVAVLAIAACWAVWFSSLFAADAVTVSGNSVVSDRAVQAAADVPVGTPLARIDLDAIRSRVAGIAEVKSVEVHRDWPHGVTIFVVERDPIAVLRRDGAWWNVDASGALFGRTQVRNHDLPVVDVAKSAGADALSEAMSVIDALPTELLGQAKRLTAKSMDSITLRMKDRSEIIWGSADDSQRKVEVLAALLAQVKAKVYDVSVPEQPTTSDRVG